MNIGRLRHRITLEERSTAQDSFGGASAWTAIDIVAAEVRPLTARELMAAQAVRSDVSHQVKIRYHSGVTTKLRIRFGSRLFDIRGVVNTNERNRELVVSCVEGLSDG